MTCCPRFAVRCHRCFEASRCRCCCRRRPGTRRLIVRPSGRIERRPRGGRLSETRAETSPCRTDFRRRHSSRRRCYCCCQRSTRRRRRLWGPRSHHHRPHRRGARPSRSYSRSTFAPERAPERGSPATANVRAKVTKNLWRVITPPRRVYGRISEPNSTQQACQAWEPRIRPVLRFYAFAGSGGVLFGVQGVTPRGRLTAQGSGKTRTA